MRTFISFEEAKQIVLEESGPIGTESCALDHALGRVLACDIVSQDNIPPFASSAMDGFAVRSKDVLEGVALQIVEHIPAGQVPKIKIKPGTCAKIMTGAPVPEGADAIVPREVVSEEQGTAVFSVAAQEGKHIRPAAEDVKKGEVVFEKGQRVTPAVVGMLATLGRSELQVFRIPEVRVFSTGDEVVQPNEEPGPGQIRNSNGPALRAQVLAAGGNCPAYVHLPDNRNAIQEAIKAHLSADIMVFSGGVSMGDHDYIKEVLEDMGMNLLFWKVRQRPGKPLAFGKLGKTLVLGLPGNPVSSSVCFLIYGSMLIKACEGENAGQKTEFAQLSQDVTKVENLHYVSRGILLQDEKGRSSVMLTGPQGSNLFGSVVRANCVIHLPEGQSLIREGAFVRVERLPW